MNRKMIFVMDISGSMKDAAKDSNSKLDEAKEGFSLFMGHTFPDEKDDFGLITFNSNIKDDEYKNGTVKNIIDYKLFVNNLIGSGRTALYDSIGHAIDQISNIKDNKSPSIIVMTDGEDNESKRFNNVDDVIEYAHSKNVDIKIFTIAIGNNINNTQLKKLSYKTNAQYLQVNESNIAEGIKSITHDIAKGDVEYHRKTGIESFGKDEWAKVHGIELNNKGLPTGTVRRPRDQFTSWIPHEDAVEIISNHLRKNDKKIYNGKIPYSRKHNTPVDIYNKTDDLIIIVIERDLNNEDYAKLLIKISKLKAEYNKSIEINFLTINIISPPEWFKNLLEEENIISKEYSFSVFTDIIGPWDSLPDFIKENSNKIPGDSYGECKHILIVYPFEKPHLNRKKVIEDISVLKNDDYFYRDFVCDNLENALEHLDSCKTQNLNKLVTIVVNRDEYLVLEEKECWIHFVNMLNEIYCHKYLNEANLYVYFSNGNIEVKPLCRIDRLNDETLK